MTLYPARRPCPPHPRRCYASAPIPGARRHIAPAVRPIATVGLAYTLAALVAVAGIAWIAHAVSGV